MRMISAFWLATSLAVFAAEASAADQPQHPLDALTSAEITSAIGLLRESKRTTEATRYVTVTLIENAKDSVLAWQPGQPFERHARVVFLQAGRLHEADVNLRRGAIESVAEVKGREPAILFEEFLGASEIVKKDERWRAAMRKRGYTRYDDIICAPLTVGSVIDPKYGGMRLLNVPCFDRAGAVNNIYGRPIENLLAVVDVEAHRVLEVIDLGKVAVPTAVPSHAYDPATSSRNGFKPVEIVSPQGANFKIDGSVVSWDKWQFHLRVDKRVGPVVSEISYRDGNDARLIAYQIYASELFVPYMDPSRAWAYKAYMDIGEYGFGALSSPLQAGSDCPAEARFLDAVIADDHGEPLTLRNVVCIFERNTGDPAWRHYEVFTESLESRPGVELVVRMAPEVGNYDYLIDFVFNMRGEIDVRAGAYGIDATKAVVSQTMADKLAKDDTAYGTLIAPGLVGVNHDHFMNFRIDMDVDGAENRLVVDRFVPRKLDANPLRQSLWQVESAMVEAEREFPQSHEPSWFRVESRDRKNALGNATSYQLMPGHSDVSILDAAEPLQRRAGFAVSPLWVTRYHPDERYASGDYPNQNPEVEGVPAYIGNQESLKDSDLVLWYTLGFRHQTRAEDWPVMPGLWHGFKLRPHNFFDHNPGLDIPSVNQGK